MHFSLLYVSKQSVEIATRCQFFMNTFMVYLFCPCDTGRQSYAKSEQTIVLCHNKAKTNKTATAISTHTIKKLL